MIQWIILGIACGMALTLSILYLLDARRVTSAEKSVSVPESSDELAGHADAVETVCLSCLGRERELTAAEIDGITEEDAAAPADPEGAVSALIVSEEKAAESGEIIIDEETKLLIDEAETEREAFIAAKKCGRCAEIPALRFTLSREDVFDHIDDRREALRSDGRRIMPSFVQRAEKHYCDVLHCGEWCFALMYERSNVIKFTLRLDDDTAAKISEEHTAFRPALFPKGKYWYDLVIDCSFGNKKEVYDILDASFDFVLGYYYRNDNGVYTTDGSAAKEDRVHIENGIDGNADVRDPHYEAAIAEYERALEKFRQRHKLPFHMTRKRVLHYAETYMQENGEVVTRQRRCLPASLRSDGRTYALVYEKLYPAEEGSDERASYVSLTVRISDGYAQWLTLRHPGVCRAGFPKNRNWYIVPIDGSFRSADMVYRVLRHAKTFVSRPDIKP